MGICPQNYSFRGPTKLIDMNNYFFAEKTRTINLKKKRKKVYFVRKTALCVLKMSGISSQTRRVPLFLRLENNYY